MRAVKYKDNVTETEDRTWSLDWRSGDIYDIHHFADKHVQMGHAEIIEVPGVGPRIKYSKECSEKFTRTCSIPFLAGQTYLRSKFSELHVRLGFAEEVEVDYGLGRFVLEKFGNASLGPTMVDDMRTQRIL
jgi:hypothetical protein